MRTSILSLATAFLGLLLNSSFARASDNTNIQLLQAWSDITKTVYSSNKCTGALPEQDGDRTILDCSALIPTEGAPLGAPWLVGFEMYHGTVYGSQFSNAVEVRVVVRKSTLEAPSFKSIGFYVSGWEFSGPYSVEGGYQKVNSDKVYLKDGEEGTVFRFVLPFPAHVGNSATGWAMGSVEFKPFVTFQVEDKVYTDWEAVPKNWRIYRTANGGGTKQINSIDRASEILK